ncbi:hypothetical protein LSAT2_006176, partial [Lamellibrachia satsuma]
TPYHTTTAREDALPHDHRERGRPTTRPSRERTPYHTTPRERTPYHTTTAREDALPHDYREKGRLTTRPQRERTPYHTTTAREETNPDILFTLNTS